jgi:predicted N-acetyltransferase YhbS
MEHTADHLRSLGCSSMVLHHVIDARGFYERLGFKPATELRRDL